MDEPNPEILINVCATHADILASDSSIAARGGLHSKMDRFPTDVYDFCIIRVSYNVTSVVVAFSFFPDLRFAVQKKVKQKFKISEIDR